jgi:hypothetical protein
VPLGILLCRGIVGYLCDAVDRPLKLAIDCTRGLVSVIVYTGVVRV